MQADSLIPCLWWLKGKTKVLCKREEGIEIDIKAQIQEYPQRC